MTYSSKEMAKLRPDLDPRVHGIRRWRRERGFTVRSVAVMLGVARCTVERIERGDASADSLALYEAFIQRWANVPSVREAAEAQLRQTALRYRVAALARNAARSSDE